MCDRFFGELLRERDLQASLPGMKTSLFLTTALAALLVTGIASAEKKTYIVEGDDVLEGANEVPPVEDGPDSTVTATARFTLDTDTKQFCGHIKPSVSTFAATAAHIHKGAAGENGDPTIILSKDGFTGNLAVNMTLDDTQIADLNGDVYVNLHTTDHPDGALRAQLSLDGDDGATPETCDDVSGTSSSSSSSSSSGASSSSSGSSGSDGASSSSSSGSTNAASPDDTSDDSGCNTTGSNTGDALAMLFGVGIVVAAASRKRKKA
jgi:hypothetical protein